MPEFFTDERLGQLIKLVKTDEFSAPELADVFSCDRKTVLRALKENSIVLSNLGRFKKKYDFNEYYFEDLDIESSYWLGFIAADGCLSLRDKCVSITLNNKDENHLVKFKKAVGANSPIIRVASVNASSISLRSKKLFSSLVNRGVKPNKSLTISNVKTDINFINHFIRGVYDGDGCISGSTPSHIQFSISGNKPFLQEIQEFLIKNCNVNKTKIYQLTQSKAFKLQYTGSQIFRILDYMYQNSTEKIRLNRKYNKYLKLKIEIENYREKAKKK